MSRSVSKYRVYCETEAAYIYTWGDTLPTVCPNNNTHTITTGTVSIVEEIQENTVSIKQESIPTGGNFKCKGYSFVATANTTTSYSVSWSYNTTAMVVHIQSNESQLGDVLEAVVYPEQTVGVITAACNIDATTAVVNSTVIANAFIGMECFIETEFLGTIISINKETSTVGFETPVTVNHAGGSAFKVQIRIIESYHLGTSIGASLGASNMGGKHLPANSVTSVRYTNNSNEDRIFIFLVEYLY